ncbi:MAG: RnfABCDGE type electron transport complex subunit G [Deltaproteobacteria bacterium]|nr:RnfABCDGE type electron transport complex subunit G [Deltaproteobacteria bacterium]
MNNVVKMFLNLVVIGAVSGAILAAFYHVADPMIKANQEKELKEAIFVVLPEAKDYKTLKKTVDKADITIFEGIDDAGAPVGIAFKADGGGFQGNVGVMVGLNLDYLHLRGIKILDQVETPGLGNRISEPAFEGQFNGVDISPKIEYIKNRKPEKPNQIQSITGATISSNAVVTNINNAVAKVLSAFPREEVERLEKEIVPASIASKELKHGR